MEKLVYLLWNSGGLTEADLGRHVLVEQVPRLLAHGAHGLTVNLADVGGDLGASVPIRSDDALPSATVSIWLDCLDDRGRYERELEASGVRIAGYLVTESVPREYDHRSWADGERSPGVKLLTVFEKPERLSTDEFLERWHGSHTPLSLEIHPMARYVRNVVVRPLTAGAPTYAGIVEEQFGTAEDLTDPMRFYAGGGSTERMQANMQRVLEDVSRFLDLERTRSCIMSEYLIKS